MHESYLNWTLESWWKMMQWAGASEDTAMVQTEPKPPRLWNGGGSRLIIGQQMQPVFGVFGINGGIGHIHKSISGQIWKLAVDQWGSLISLSKLSWIVSLTWTRWMVAWHASSGLTHIDVRGWAGKKPSICVNTGYPAFVFGLPVLQAYRLQLSRKWAGRFCPCIFLLWKWSIQRITSIPAFFLPDIRYRLSRNRNLKYGNRISRSGTNTWFLFCSTRNWCTDRPACPVSQVKS